jgi:hypothetical protein
LIILSTVPVPGGMTVNDVAFGDLARVLGAPTARRIVIGNFIKTQLRKCSSITMNHMTLEQIHIWAKIHLMKRADRNRFLEECVEMLRNGQGFGDGWNHVAQLITFRNELEHLKTFPKVSDKRMLQLYKTYGSFQFFKKFEEKLQAYQTNS